MVIGSIPYLQMDLEEPQFGLLIQSILPKRPRPEEHPQENYYYYYQSTTISTNYLPQQISFGLHYKHTWRGSHVVPPVVVEELLFERLYLAGYRLVSREEKDDDNVQYTVVRTVC